MWREFPTQIRSDLQLHYGRHIRDWHRGEMSSAELVDLLNGLPETSRYKGARRGLPFGVEYEWAPEEYRMAALARQLAPLNDDGDLTIPRLLYEAYFSPVERVVMERKQAREDEQRRRGHTFVMAGALGLRKAVTS